VVLSESPRLRRLRASESERWGKVAAKWARRWIEAVSGELAGPILELERKAMANAEWWAGLASSASMDSAQVSPRAAGAHEAAGLGAMLLMYDENVRF